MISISVSVADLTVSILFLGFFYVVAKIILQKWVD